MGRETQAPPCQELPGARICACPKGSEINFLCPGRLCGTALGPNPDGACHQLCDCGWGVLAWSLSSSSLRSEQWLPLMCNSRPLPRPPIVVIIAKTETFSEDRTSLGDLGSLASSLIVLSDRTSSSDAYCTGLGTHEAIECLTCEFHSPRDRVVVIFLFQNFLKLLIFGCTGSSLLCLDFA